MYVSTMNKLDTPLWCGAPCNTGAELSPTEESLIQERPSLTLLGTAELARCGPAAQLDLPAVHESRVY